ncbi:hypothetical protein EYF80_054978 [Liparis tanakae]|uniref:Uncharacterized protein n=1 Tax=Liparis tanakae TaxID=230148 RepID=A0A4Z2F0X5_9TELE|nr:hypothetical protein EYF80_054978 [Liparis tanakae]
MPPLSSSHIIFSPSGVGWVLKSSSGAKGGGDEEARRKEMRPRFNLWSEALGEAQGARFRGRRPRCSSSSIEKQHVAQ